MASKADRGDRRRLVLELTPEGETELANRILAALGVSAETLAPLTKPEQAQF